MKRVSYRWWLSSIASGADFFASSEEKQILVPGRPLKDEIVWLLPFCADRKIYFWLRPLHDSLGRRLTSRVTQNRSQARSRYSSRIGQVNLVVRPVKRKTLLASEFHHA